MSTSRFTISIQAALPRGMAGGYGASMPGMPGSDMSSMMPGGMPGGYGAAMPGMPGMMPGDGGDMYGSGGYGGQYGATMQRGPQVDYLLIRFFDFNAEMGKKYRYRIQLLVEDPNHPQDFRMEPSERFLDESAKKRLAEVVANETERRQFYIRTDFSQPSDVVEVEMKSSAIAGTIAPTSVSSLRQPDGRDLIIPVDEPSGKMMAVALDPQRAVDVPGIVDVYRGTVLNFKTNADAIHPVTLQFKKLTDVDIRTDKMVADIRGGIELPQSPAPPAQRTAPTSAVMPGSVGMSTGYDRPMTPEKPATLYSMGEYVLIDADGNLKIRNEFDDYKDFRRLSLPAQAENTMGGYGMPGDADAAVMPGDSMPGDDGGGGRRRRGR
jgi:hypothetical protein